MLEEKLQPTTLAIRDDSTKHKNHKGFVHGEETHLHIVVASRAFQGKSRLDRHRMILEIIRGEFDKGLHAVSIDPKES
jgi:BolA protein